MTPEEKAKALINKFTFAPIYFTTYEDGAKMNAKQCALIAVEHILQELDHLPFDDQDFGTSKMKYWQEVKQEIEKL